MSTLKAEQAAVIARGVYFLRGHTVSSSVAQHDVLGSEGLFKVTDDSQFKGLSGGLYCCKILSDFGYIAEGTAQHKGEILVVTRGTAIPIDWLSNASVGLQRGPGGELVHVGFHEVWKSIAPDISRFLRGRHPTTIHCVGHSLGGALAALNADYFSSIGAGQVKLYTFGSPRVGTAAFARNLDARVGAANMYRVFHRADAVPMVPLFPFFHVPTTTPGYQIANGSRGLISAGAHNVEESYVAGVSGQSWADLRSRDLTNDHKMNVQLWLEKVATNSGGVLMGSTWVLAMICKALTWILDKTALLAFTGLGLGLTSALTAVDYLALLLARGASLSLDISNYLRTVVMAIFGFLGRSVVAGASMTVDFLRWVLGLFYQSLAMVARGALAMLK